MSIKNFLQNLLYYGVILYGLGIIFIEYLPYLVTSGKDFRFAASKICFYYLQIVFYALSTCLIKVIFTSKFSRKDILFFTMLSTIMTYYKTTFVADNFFKDYGLYLNIFKPESSNSNELFFQYSLIMIVTIIFMYAIGHMVLLKKTIIRIFFLLISFSYFIFFYFGHAFMVKDAYIDYLGQNRIRLEQMINNSDNYKVLCEKLKYQCLITDGKDIPPFNIEIKNLGHQGRYMEKDTLEERNARADGIKVITNVIKEFVSSDKKERIYTSYEIEGNNLRGMNAAAKKLGDNKFLVILDFNYLTYGIDLYLFYISFLTTCFLTVWSTLIYYLYRIHKRNPLVKKLGLTEGETTL